MKKNIIKIALLSLFFFAIISCKDTNTEKAKNSLPNPEDIVGAVEKQDDCSWCGNPLKEKRFQVNVRKINKKNMFVYALGGPLGGTAGLVGTEPGPFAGGSLKNPYNGLNFCCLKCLNEFSSSKLVNTKFELVNNDGFELGRGGGPLDFNEGNK